MKRNRKIFIFAISILLILSLLVGCSGRKSLNMDSAGSAPSMPAPTPTEKPQRESEEDAKGELGFNSDFTNQYEPKKIITTVYLALETTEFEKSNEDLSKLIEKYKGYVEYSNISYNHYYDQKMYRYGEFTIRIPRENIVSFRTETNLIGHIVSESSNKQDVTKQYQDTESRLKVVTVKEERILALLEKAQKIEDIIALERELSDVIYEKESLKSSLINLDDKVDFSTVNINIQEVQKITDTETIETTFVTRMKNAFKNSLYAFKSGMENFVIGLIYNLPFLIVVAIILFIAYKFFKKAKNKIKNKIDKID